MGTLNEIIYVKATAPMTDSTNISPRSLKKILRNKNILSPILNTYLVHSLASGYEDVLIVLGRLIFSTTFQDLHSEIPQ